MSRSFSKARIEQLSRSVFIPKGACESGFRNGCGEYGWVAVYNCWYLHAKTPFWGVLSHSPEGHCAAKGARVLLGLPTWWFKQSILSTHCEPSKLLTAPMSTSMASPFLSLSDVPTWSPCVLVSWSKKLDFGRLIIDSVSVSHTGQLISLLIMERSYSETYYSTGFGSSTVSAWTCQMAWELWGITNSKFNYGSTNLQWCHVIHHVQSLSGFCLYPVLSGSPHGSGRRHHKWNIVRVFNMFQMRWFFVCSHSWQSFNLLLK